MTGRTQEITDTDLAIARHIRKQGHILRVGLYLMQEGQGGAMLHADAGRCGNRGIALSGRNRCGFQCAAVAPVEPGTIFQNNLLCNELAGLGQRGVVCQSHVPGGQSAALQRGAANQRGRISLQSLLFLENLDRGREGIQAYNLFGGFICVAGSEQPDSALAVNTEPGGIQIVVQANLAAISKLHG